MRSSHVLDRLEVTFDDDHAVASAGLVLPAVLAAHLGMEALANEVIDLGDGGGGPPRRKVMVHSIMAGGDCIDDADVLRSGSTAEVLSIGSWPRPRWTRSCGRSPSVTSANSTGSPKRC